MTSVGEPSTADRSMTEHSKTEQLKDRFTAPEAAPVRRGGGAAVAMAAATLGLWAWRRYRARSAARRQRMAARKHMKIIGHETKAVARLGASALGEGLRSGAQTARRQAGNGAQAARRRARVRVETAKARAAKARR